MSGGVDLEPSPALERAPGAAGDDSEAAVPPAPGQQPESGSRGGRRALALVVVAVVVGLLGLLGWGLLRQGQVPGVAVNTTGQIGRVPPGPAPDFALQLYDGGTFRLAEQRGKVVVVNYWASWCPPCREEAPILERGWRLYRDRGVVFVGLDIWDTEQDARAFLRRYGVTYPNGPDPGGAAAVDYGLTGLPETFFIRADGTIARHWIGPLTSAQLAAFVEEALR